MATTSEEITRQHVRLYGLMRTAREERDEASSSAAPLPGAPGSVSNERDATLKNCVSAFDVAERGLREFEAKHGLKRMG